jgi:hypothetical protein
LGDTPKPSAGGLLLHLRMGIPLPRPEMTLPLPVPQGSAEGRSPFAGSPRVSLVPSLYAPKTGGQRVERPTLQHPFLDSRLRVNDRGEPSLPQGRMLGVWACPMRPHVTAWSQCSRMLPGPGVSPDATSPSPKNGGPRGLNESVRQSLRQAPHGGESEKVVNTNKLGIEL